MGAWLTKRNANRAAWVVLAAMVAAPLAFGAALLVGRARATHTGGATTTATAEAETPQPPSRAAFTTMLGGEIARAEGGAFVLRATSGREERVLLRAGATVQVVTTARGPQALQVGDPIVLPATAARRETQPLVNEILVATPPEPVDEERCSQVGTVTAISGAVVAYDSRCGAQRVSLSPGVRVVRLAPATVAALETGKRVSVTAERLADGTLAATLVQILEGR